MGGMREKGVEREKEKMNNVHCHKCDIRVENYLLDLAARSPVAQLRTALRNSRGKRLEY